MSAQDSQLGSVAEYDVVIVGGGPAGCATALALRHLGISRILVVEAGYYEASRVGESIPPDTAILLRELGIWEDFVQEKHEACFGSCSSWGDDALGYNDFLFNPHGNGWHLDRRRFDAFLARKAAESGAEVCMGTRFEDCQRIGNDGFRLQLTEDGGKKTVRAYFVVDATGMRCRFARRLGAERLFLDRLICVYGFFEIPISSSFSKLTMLEAVEYGWWYAARLPNHRLAVAVASDAEIIRQASLNKNANWIAHLKETNYMSRELAHCLFVENSLLVCAAPSFLLDRATGNGWLAVGDAAASYDPISSQGIYKALSDGLQMANVIGANLGENTDRLHEYQSSTTANFDAYLQNRNYFYGLENRWPNSPFWNRRKSANHFSSVKSA